MDSPKQINQLNKQLLTSQLLSLPGAIMLGIGFYGFFVGANGQAFHPLLNDQNVVYGILAIGAAIEAVSMIRFVNLTRRRAKLVRRQTELS